MSVLHVFGSIPSSALAVHDRVCRPGAVFGPEDLEERMGVRRCVHEAIERKRAGVWKCTTCGRVES